MINSEEKLMENRLSIEDSVAYASLGRLINKYTHYINCMKPEEKSNILKEIDKILSKFDLKEAITTDNYYGQAVDRVLVHFWIDSDAYDELIDLFESRKYTIRFATILDKKERESNEVIERHKKEIEKIKKRRLEL